MFKKLAYMFNKHYFCSPKLNNKHQTNKKNIRNHE